jgi:5-dehydro-2-deoxygluconokinase
VERFYDIGVYPDWWKLEPMTSAAAWANVCDTISRRDPHCRGIVLLGLEAPSERLAESFAAAASHDMVKGFAVGRTIFAEAMEHWLAGRWDDETAVAAMARRYGALCASWDQARSGIAA